MNEPLSHKQTRFGEIVSPVTIEGEGLREHFLHGIKVRTNNSSLTSQLSVMATEKPEDLGVEFLYLTGQAANIGDMYTLQPMDESHAGEISTNYQLDRFVFSGLDKLGTLVSMVYGIRALKQADRGIAGIHSASVWDEQLQQIHLIIGANRSGKSTLTFELEADGRFEVLADDWNEIDVDTWTIAPLSNIYSGSNLNPERYYPVFQSFGKTFHRKQLRVEGGKLGKVVVLNGQNMIDPDELFRDVQSHIPFVANSATTELSIEQLTMGTAADHMTQLVQERILLLRGLFMETVFGNGNSLLVNDKTRPVADLVQDLIYIIDSK